MAIKLLTFISILLFHLMNAHAQSGSALVLLETDLGNMKIRLYDQTPMHKDNFLELIEKGYYDGQLFHRVISGFMIQTGDINSKNAAPGVRPGSGGPGYTIPAEFHPDLFHKKGAVAAARKPDRVNPQKASSGSQFYIVQGKKLSDEQLNLMEKKGNHIRFTDKQREIYREAGGTPHLDYNYTVFGEVVEGLEVIDRIASVKTDPHDRPLEAIHLKMRILEN